MIISFYDNNFKGLQNNASLRVDNDGYKLIKRPVELNELACTCEAFSEDIQPTFLVISDARGRYVYGSLAGIPLLNSENKTEINGTDLRSMLSSDVILDKSDFATVNEAINYIFTQWFNQVNQNSFNCELVDNSEIISVGDLVPLYTKGQYNALEEMQSLMRYYKLYLDTKIDFINKKIQFIIGQTMLKPVNVKLWEHGVKNYGKFIADVNECQGYVVKTENDVTTWYTTYDGVESIRWILTSNNNITNDTTKRDIYPIKRRIVTSSENMNDANALALETLLDSTYNEDIELPADIIKPDFETRFDVYVERGKGLYKQLPCGELQYDSSGLVRFKIGYRYTGVNFI
ncbi:MAG: hypothetical protein IKV81_06575 [Clostridia bacterium]|nr:hypothetical protein [Clostridia bacterium]